MKIWAEDLTLALAQTHTHTHTLKQAYEIHTYSTKHKNILSHNRLMQTYALDKNGVSFIFDKARREREVDMMS